VQADQALSSDGGSGVASAGLEFLDLESLRRRGGAKWTRYGPEVLAAWIADMDCAPPPPILAGLEEILRAQDLGYPSWGAASPLREAFSSHMARRFGWEASPCKVRETTDIVQGMQLALWLLTSPGDAVALHVPCYPPFIESIEAMSRRLVPIQMEPSESGWSFDQEKTEALVAKAACRALVLVNPQNPTGHVFREDELAWLADLARRHGLWVISDEVWAELVFEPNLHVPFASLDEDTAKRTVTLFSSTKTYNMAAIRCAIAHFGPEETLASLDAHPSRLFGQPNIFGIAATLAAWSNEADKWRRQLLEHLEANRRQLSSYLAEMLPGCLHAPPDATYLAWLDLRGFGLGERPAERILAGAGVALSEGAEFGPGGEGHVRLNFATSEGLLSEILKRLVQFLAA
jgi:cystathionine beta-lyase